MAITTHTVTGNIADLLGDTYDKVRVTVRTNLEDGAVLVDQENNTVLLGYGAVTVTGGILSISGLLDPASDDVNATGIQYQFVIDYADKATRRAASKTLGWYSITSDTTFADLVAEQYDPPNYRSAFIAEAEAIRDQQQAIAGLTGEDEAMANIAADSGSEFAGVLSAQTAQQIEDETPGVAQPLIDMAVAPALAPAFTKQRTPKCTVWSAFQSGHGWTTAGSGITWNLNDTSDKLVGSQSVKFTTSGTQTTSAWIQSLNATARDLTSSDITIWLKIASGLDALKSIGIFLTSDNLVNYYNGTVYDGTWPAAPVRQMRQGEWFPLRFNFGAMTNAVAGTPNKAAITGMRIAIIDKNTGTPVVGYIGKIEYHARATTYPNGVVSLSFDDSLLDTYTTALPILAQRGLSATEYAIADLAMSNPASMTVANLHDLENYGWEVAAHAYTVANHDAGFNVLSDSVLNAELRNLKAWLNGEGFRGADHLAYPLGRHTAATDACVRRYYATGRTLYDLPQESLRPARPLRLRCLQIGPATSVGTVTAAIDRASTNGSWLIICAHGVVGGTPTGSQISAATLTSIADYLAASTVSVAPVGDVWRSLV